MPAVLISPYIEAGRIDTRIYDHTSIIGTVFKLFLPNVANANLTERDKNANTFEDNLTLAQPRTDKIDLGTGAKSQPPTSAELAQPINEHLQALVHQAALAEQRLPPSQQSGIDPSTIKTEAQAAQYLQMVHDKIHSKGNGSND